MDLSAARGVAVREFKMADGYGFSDYLLFVDERPAGVVEAKPAGHTLSGVQTQTEKYSTGLPTWLSAPVRPLPFIYASTGEQTLFKNLTRPGAAESRGVLVPPARDVRGVARCEACQRVGRVVVTRRA